MNCNCPRPLWHRCICQPCRYLSEICIFLLTLSQDQFIHAATINLEALIRCKDKFSLKLNSLSTPQRACTGILTPRPPMTRRRTFVRRWKGSWPPSPRYHSRNYWRKSSPVYSSTPGLWGRQFLGSLYHVLLLEIDISNHLTTNWQSAFWLLLKMHFA